MAGRNRLTILVDAKNNASGQLRSVGSDVSSIAQSIEGAFSLDGAISGIGQLSPALGTVAAAAAGVGVAVGGWKLATAVGDLGRLGAGAQRVSDGFNDLARDAGQSGNAMLDALRGASAGAINNQQLMISASRSMMLGVADSADEMSALMAVAVDRGRKLGMDAQTAFNDLVTGLGRASPQILDNLAIMVDSEQVFGAYAASIGKSATALTDAEKKQALVNQVVAEGRDLMREQGTATVDAAASFERMDAAISNSKEALGQLFAPAVAAVAENIARAAEAATAAMQGMGEAIDENSALGNVQAYEGSLQRQAQELAQARNFLTQIPSGSDEYAAQMRVISESELQMVRTSRELEAARAAYFDVLRQIYPAQEQDAASLNRTSMEAQAAAQAQQYFNDALTNQTGAVSQATASMDLLGGSYDLLLQRSEALQSSQSQLASISSQMIVALGETGAVDLYGQMTAELEQQIAAWQAVGYSAQAIQDILLPAYIAQLRDSTVGALNLADASRQSATELNRVQASALGAAQGLGQTGGMFANVAAAANAMADQVAAAAARLDQFAASAAAGMASDLVAAKGAGAAVTYYNAINGQIQRQTTMWQEQGYSIEEIEGVLLPGYVSGLRKATTQTFGLGNATRGVGAATAQISQEWQNLQSTVGSVISSALGDIGGINLDDMLPRQDSVSEDARRLADVAVNGFKSPWASYFQSEFPQLWGELTAGGDIQNAAAQMLRDFQDGLRPELIDKDRAKEIVKRSILGDQNTKALVDEISKELASELGISMQEAKAAATSALGGGGLLGDAMGSDGSGKLTITPVMDQSLLPTAIAIPGSVKWETPLLDTSEMTVTVQGNVDWQDGLAPTIEWQDVDTETARVALTEKLSLKLAPWIDWQSAEVETARVALTERMVVVVTPQVSTALSDVSGALLYLEQELAPIVTPYINYLGISPENYANARTFITENLPVLVTPQLDTNSDGVVANTLVAGSNLAMGIMEAIKAYDLPGAIAFELAAGTGMYNAGSTNGQLFASGFMDFFGGNVPGHVVNVLFNLVWSKIQAENSKKASK